MVSGIATRMITVALSSGRSARLAAAAGPMRDCAQAVASAGIPMASAALSASRANVMACPFGLRGLAGLGGPVAQRAVANAAGAVEGAEELHVVEAERVNGRGEEGQREVHRVEEQRE